MKIKRYKLNKSEFDVIEIYDGDKHIVESGKPVTLCGKKLMPGEEKNIAKDFTLRECTRCTTQFHRLMAKYNKKGGG